MSSVTNVLEALRRRADDGCPLGLDFEHGEAALHEATGCETKQSVDAGEAARVEDRLLRERLACLAACQHCGERRPTPAERTETRRGGAIGRAEPPREIPPRLVGKPR